MKSILTKNCLQCSAEFTTRRADVNRGNGKYCSLKCSSQHRGALRITPKVNNVKCASCEEPLYRRPSSVKTSKNGLFFCNRKCKEIAQTIGTERSIPKIHPPHFGTSQSKHSYRKRAPNERGLMCEGCGYDKIVGILQVHHIDRNRNNGDLSNLKVLCPTCHYEDHYLQGDGIYTNHGGGTG